MMRLLHGREKGKTKSGTGYGRQLPGGSGDRVEINIYPNYERIPERFDLTDEVYIEAA
jgi:hypothetical protein